MANRGLAAFVVVVLNQVLCCLFYYVEAVDSCMLVSFSILSP